MALLDLKASLETQVRTSQSLIMLFMWFLLLLFFVVFTDGCFYVFHDLGSLCGLLNDSGRNSEELIHFKQS